MTWNIRKSAKTKPCLLEMVFYRHNEETFSNKCRRQETECPHRIFHRKVRWQYILFVFPQYPLRATRACLRFFLAGFRQQKCFVGEDKAALLAFKEKPQPFFCPCKTCFLLPKPNHMKDVSLLHMRFVYYKNALSAKTVASEHNPALSFVREIYFVISSFYCFPFWIEQIHCTAKQGLWESMEHGIETRLQLYGWAADNTETRCLTWAFF